MSTSIAIESQRRPWAGYLLGFAIGGFFDGILLHQILQWHHLLLGIQSGPFRDMRVQILADGLFHLLMYVIALAGIWSLWRAKQSAYLSDRDIASDALIGFGAWHVIDGIVSHWILGIHRIKMDSENPLLWDLVWFLLFGVVPLVIGFIVRRNIDSGDHAPRRAAAALMLVALTGAFIATVPPRETQQVAVLVRPRDVGQLLDALPSVGAGILWADRSGSLWVLRVTDAASARRLYQHGALFVTRSPAALGCLAWTRSPVSAE